ncbi:glycosyltransferase family 4 protein [Roseibium sp.]|uniref:glycosyltransferase family 4 protein n=1 Tax=Roseibium sp. TaxID=1936156 RepID=UPI0039EE0975
MSTKRVERCKAFAVEISDQNFDLFMDNMSKTPPISDLANGASGSAAVSGSVEQKTNSSVPHYGKTVHKLVESARLRAKNRDRSDVYDAICDEFDTCFYLMRNRDVVRAKLDPIQHYISHGAKEGRDPSPNFSTSRYVHRYPEVRESGLNPFFHWLTIGRSKGYIAEPFGDFDSLCEIVDKSPHEVQEILTRKRQEMRERFEYGTLGEMVAKAAQIEPLISHTWPEALQVKFPPFNVEPAVKKLNAFCRLQKAAKFTKAKVVFVINRPRWGGGRRMEGHIAHAIEKYYGSENFLVIYSDQSDEVWHGRFPDGSRHIDFAAETKDLPVSEKQRVLVEFIRSLDPEAVFNINSKLLWDSLKVYGKALTATVPIYACLFCNDQDAFGFWGGYPSKFFYRYFDMLKGVLCDSHFLADQLVHRHLVPAAQKHKVVVLRAPVDPSIEPTRAPPLGQNRRPQVFWAGRFDKQKRVDIVLQLAERLPHVDFRLWGGTNQGSSLPFATPSKNVVLEGKYDRFSELPLAECDVWLYTSAWDGVPSMLIEVSMTGVPIVGTLVGGTGEILQENMSWRISDIENVDAYRDGIVDVLNNSNIARERAKNLREYLLRNRTVESYQFALEKLLSAHKAS